jgi:hypothetical protein
MWGAINLSYTSTGYDTTIPVGCIGRPGLGVSIVGTVGRSFICESIS